MRRALDTAKANLATLENRDAILDCFFEHARPLFQFSVFFVVRGDGAYGRDVDGIGPSKELVSRIAVPLNEPGMLQQARDARRPFVTGTSRTRTDEYLFGVLGRVIASGLVVPLVVRDRVVAVFLGDVPSQALQQRAPDAGRPAVELAKDEMLVWREAVGEKLEQLILRRKTGTSVPPPGKAPSIPPPMMMPQAPRLPADMRVPGTSTAPTTSAAPSAPAVEPQVVAMNEADESPKPASRGRGTLLFLAALVVAGAIGAGMWWTRREPDADRVVVNGSSLPGWPLIDPTSAIDPAMQNAVPGGKAELAVIAAEVGRAGKVDTAATPTNASGVILVMTFLTADREIDVRVDGRGIHSGRVQMRKPCTPDNCLAPVPTPQCTFAQIREQAAAAGLREDDRALVTYSDSRKAPNEGAAKPEWVLEVNGRGRIHLDASTCKPLPRERLLPPALPASAVPGAPHDVDPVGILSLARTQAGLGDDAELHEIDARGVKPNGKVDLASVESDITYMFADPAGVKGQNRRWRRIRVTADGIPSPSLEGDTSPPPARLSGALKPPACSFAHAYKTLGPSAAGMPAHVVFGADAVSGQGGEFRIEVATSGVRKRIGDIECAEWEKLAK